MAEESALSDVAGYAGDRGGLAWTRDIVDLFDKYEINYLYAFYHIHDLGIYSDVDSLSTPATTNQELIDLFTELHSQD